MRFFTLEHSKASHLADVAAYLGAIVFGFWLLLKFGPKGEWLEIGALIASGLIAWSFLEYVLHRFVLHGIEPFRRWHIAHHDRPHALIGTPTLFSATLILAFIFFPAFMISNLWIGTGLTLGVVMGYLGYSCTHHAVHHWRPHTFWLKNRKRAHATHHAKTGCQYGVTSAFWDYVFGSFSDPQRVNRPTL